MHCQVAALRVENLLLAGTEVDRGQAALVVADVGKAVRHREQVGRAIRRRRDGQARRDLVDIRLQRHDLRPAGFQDLGAVARFVLVYFSVQAIGVDVLALRIDRRRARRQRCRRRWLVRPDQRTIGGVQCQRRAVPADDEQQVPRSDRRRDIFQKHRRDIRRQRQRRGGEREAIAVRGRITLLRAVVSVVRGVHAELQPVRGRQRRRSQHAQDDGDRQQPRRDLMLHLRTPLRVV